MNLNTNQAPWGKQTIQLPYNELNSKPVNETENKFIAENQHKRTKRVEAHRQAFIPKFKGGEKRQHKLTHYRNFASKRHRVKNRYYPKANIQNPIWASMELDVQWNNIKNKFQCWYKKKKKKNYHSNRGKKNLEKMAGISKSFWTITRWFVWEFSGRR